MNLATFACLGYYRILNIDFSLSCIVLNLTPIITLDDCIAKIVVKISSTPS